MKLLFALFGAFCFTLYGFHRGKEFAIKRYGLSAAEQERRRLVLWHERIIPTHDALMDFVNSLDELESFLCFIHHPKTRIVAGAINKELN